MEPGPTFTAADKAAHQRAYEDALIDRYIDNKPLSKADRAEARRIIKARAPELFVNARKSAS